MIHLHKLSMPLIRWYIPRITTHMTIVVSDPTRLYWSPFAHYERNLQNPVTSLSTPILKYQTWGIPTAMQEPQIIYGDKAKESEITKRIVTSPQAHQQMWIAISWIKTLISKPL